MTKLVFTKNYNPKQLIIKNKNDILELSSQNIVVKINLKTRIAVKTYLSQN
jgi:hypothetical protein